MTGVQTCALPISKRAVRWKPSTAALECQSRQAVRPACLLDVLIAPQWVAPFGCDPKATLMRPASQGQARRLGGAPLYYPCVTAVLPLFHWCFPGLHPFCCPCNPLGISAAPRCLHQDHAHVRQHRFSRYSNQFASFHPSLRVVYGVRQRVRRC